VEKQKKKSWLEQSDKRLDFFSIAVIIVSTAVVTYFHYGIPKHHSIIHLSHYYAFYMIVIYAAYRFGLKGGITVSFLLTVIYSPRAYLHIIQLDIPHHIQPAVVEISMVYAVGLIAGYFSSKLRNEKIKVEEVSKEMLELERQVAHDDRLRVLGQLSAGIAHEIRNPLAAIKSGMSMIKSGKDTEQVIDIVQTEIAQLDTFIDRFLQYSRLGAGKPENFDLAIFMDELTELVKLAASRKNVHIQTSLQIPEGYTFYGDKNSIKQALLNIVLNGVEASSGKKDALVKISVNADADNVLFQISDNGGGISEDSISKIFEPFYTTKSDGTGLGLALAMKTAKEQGGELSVKNNAEGCVFTMQFKGGGK